MGCCKACLQDVVLVGCHGAASRLRAHHSYAQSRQCSEMRCSLPFRHDAEAAADPPCLKQPQEPSDANSRNLNNYNSYTNLLKLLHAPCKAECFAELLTKLCCALVRGLA